MFETTQSEPAALLDPDMSCPIKSGHILLWLIPGQTVLPHFRIRSSYATRRHCCAYTLPLALDADVTEQAGGIEDCKAKLKG